MTQTGIDSYAKSCAPKRDDSAFRAHLPDLTSPRFISMHQKRDVHEYTNSFLENREPPWLHALYSHWMRLFKEPFRGITNDGRIREKLFELQDEGIPIEDLVKAANEISRRLTPDQKQKTCLHIESPEWRSWSNPEFLFSDKGIRLDEVAHDMQALVFQLLRLTLSEEGYSKALRTMQINDFLGKLVQAPRILNAKSYNFVLFGDPSVYQPWGYSFYGHHLCLSIFFYKRQIVISPWFTGAEPNVIDDGEYKGTKILEKEETLGLRLMQSLDPEQQRKARVYKEMKDPSMPYGRWNHDDQRHLCGAYRDNRTIPYEGILVSDMTTDNQKLVDEIMNAYLCYLPDKARAIRLAHVKSWYHETHWCWIGGNGEHDPFYYRIQSPVIIVEFDHHSGVFLTNTEPAKFHIHTLLRTPNGGDYGVALRSLVPKVQQEFVWQG